MTTGARTGDRHARDPFAGLDHSALCRSGMMAWFFLYSGYPMLKRSRVAGPLSF